MPTDVTASFDAKLQTPKDDELAHIPNLPCPPVIGHTLSLLADPYGFHHRARTQLGPIYKIKLLGQWRVTLGGADALELILGDTEKLFSSANGWDMLHRLFPGGLMLRDFDDHRSHRRIMQSAFRKPMIDAYRARMQTLMPALLAQWPDDTSFRAFPAIKQLTLRMGAAVFMGLDVDDSRVDKLNAAFQAEVAAAMGIVRAPLPLTKMRRGVIARNYLLETFRELIPERRANPGDDFFSQMCCAQDEAGKTWSEQEILDHFNFLMIAAHDTTAATISKVIWALGQFPDWQDRVRCEIMALPEGPLDDEGLATLEITDRVFREAMRLLPPVPFIPRRAVRAFSWKGTQIPAGTWVSALPGLVMMSPEHWTDPERFDPDRFSPNRAEDRSHKYAWAPFGGGAHKCIGLHFAGLQVKILLVELLRNRRVTLADTKPTQWARIPIPAPKGGLPIVLSGL
ncbi:MAG: cytochrome P450 [Aliishimia sp.]